jgi:hypothetical protein
MRGRGVAGSHSPMVGTLPLRGGINADPGKPPLPSPLDALGPAGPGTTDGDGGGG